MSYVKDSVEYDVVEGHDMALNECGWVLGKQLRSSRKMKEKVRRCNHEGLCQLQHCIVSCNC